MTAEIKSIVARVLEIPVDSVHDDLSPETSGVWTSLNHVRLIAAVEDAYSIKFQSNEIRSVRSVSALRRIVLMKTGGRRHESAE
ncbi:Phosphopantetheine attachment site [Streptomyces misionensis]|uniref:Phosphopantetheine attachment site n=1 Tax=Streptomyces misionensis TaxID=67331 RepID=A0A1H4I9R0_9ACTN|nr:Phosphopantetheine attachment site [Streptomyces misionensis]